MGFWKRNSIDDFKELSEQQLTEIIDKGIDVKRNKEKYQDALSGSSLAMIFQKT